MKTKDLSERMRLVFSWVFSVIMFLAALGTFQTSFMAGILVTCIAVVILPPFNSWLYKKYDIKLTFWFKFAVFFFLMLEAYGGSPPPQYTSYILEALWQLVAAPLITGIIIIGLGFGIQYNRSKKNNYVIT